MTVCALPSSDLQISPTLNPSADASIAARRPAPPAPMTRTSWSCRSNSLSVMSARSFANLLRTLAPNGPLRQGDPLEPACVLGHEVHRRLREVALELGDGGALSVGIAGERH